ncbi:MAG: sulfatase, partial [Actinomycetota bacterium]|nr:sulfatase [Actinomycetota bacterium]
LGGIRKIMSRQGARFARSFVSYSLCCPARATTLTGRYTHNHPVRHNVPPTGGEPEFRRLGADQSTLATWLRDAGYRTAFVGKYMNGYNDTYVPPGWNKWFARMGRYTNYKINDNGTEVSYDPEAEHDTDLYARHSNDYITSVYEEESDQFVANAADGRRPFFMMISTDAPHQPAVPPARHQGRFAKEPLPRTRSFNERNVSDKPNWLQRMPRLRKGQIDRMRRLYRGRLDSMLAVEDLLRSLVAKLDEAGELANTYIVFTSDNGYHMGQHRLRHGKRTVYEEDIGVPLMVRGPGVPAGAVRRHLVVNNDLAPTFADLAGASAPGVDGRSLAPLLTADPPPVPSWRKRILIENWRSPTVNGISPIPNFKAVRTGNMLFVRYASRERELYDLRTDPHQLRSRKHTHPANRRAVRRLARGLRGLHHCAGQGCVSAEN